MKPNTDGLTTVQIYNKGVIALNRGDYDEAAEFFLVAAEQGNANAQYALGYMYDEGYYKKSPLGFTMNATRCLATAYMWYGRAGLNGHAGAEALWQEWVSST